MKIFDSQPKPEVTRKTRFKLWHTTSPYDQGLCDTKPTIPWYKRAEKGWKPDLRGTVKTLLEKWPEEKRFCGLNSGIYYSVHIVDEYGRYYSISELKLLYYQLWERID